MKREGERVRERVRARHGERERGKENAGTPHHRLVKEGEEGGRKHLYQQS